MQFLFKRSKFTFFFSSGSNEINYLEIDHLNLHKGKVRDLIDKFFYVLKDLLEKFTIQRPQSIQRHILRNQFKIYTKIFLPFDILSLAETKV